MTDGAHDVSWKDIRHLERLLAEADRRYGERFASNDVALKKAEDALREYKIGSNEWRDALKDANNRMATRIELEKVDAAVQELQRAQANRDGRIAVFSGVIAALVSLLVGIAVRLFG